MRIREITLETKRVYNLGNYESKHIGPFQAIIELDHAEGTNLEKAAQKISTVFAFLTQRIEHEFREWQKRDQEAEDKIRSRAEKLVDAATGERAK